MLYASEYIQTGTVCYPTGYPHYITIRINYPDFKNGNLQGCKYKTLFSIAFANKTHKRKLVKWFKDNFTTVTSPAICLNSFKQFAKENNIRFIIKDN